METQSPNTVELSTGEKVKLVSWPLRPAFHHVKTINRLQKIFNEDPTTDVNDNDLTALCEAIKDGSTLSLEAVEKLNIADALLLVKRIAEYNCHPMKGLLSQTTKPKK